MRIFKKLFWVFVFVMALRFAIGGPIALVAGILDLVGALEEEIVSYAIPLGLAYTGLGGFVCYWSGKKLFGKAKPPEQARKS